MSRPRFADPSPAQLSLISIIQTIENKLGTVEAHGSVVDDRAKMVGWLWWAPIIERLLDRIEALEKKGETRTDGDAGQTHNNYIEGIAYRIRK